MKQLSIFSRLELKMTSKTTIIIESNDAVDSNPQDSEEPGEAVVDDSSSAPIQENVLPEKTPEPPLESSDPELPQPDNINSVCYYCHLRIFQFFRLQN